MDLLDNIQPNPSRLAYVDDKVCFAYGINPNPDCAGGAAQVKLVTPQQPAP